MAEYDSSDPEHVRSRSKEVNSREIIRMAGLAGIMKTNQGRAWMWDLLNRTHVFGISCPPFNAEVYFKEGERNIGLQIFMEVQKNHPQEYLQMVAEANTPLPVPKKGEK